MKNFLENAIDYAKNVGMFLLEIITTPKYWAPFLAITWMITGVFGVIFGVGDIDVAEVLVMGMVTSLYMDSIDK